jgi:hypothetical protein
MVEIKNAGASSDMLENLVKEHNKVRALNSQTTTWIGSQKT